MLEAIGKEGYIDAAARRVGCSHQHVDNVLWQLKKKLHLASTIQAVVYAVERGWISNITLDRETKWLLYGGGLQGAQQPGEEAGSRQTRNVT